jgi:hypothetical protein
MSIHVYSRRRHLSLLLKACSQLWSPSYGEKLNSGNQHDREKI